MNRWRAGLTRVEVWFIAGGLAFLMLAAALLPALARSRAEGRRANCAKNLEMIGRALAAYRNDNGDYFPFSQGPACSVPNGLNNAAASSLGTLYRKYLTTAHPFRCPATEDRPGFASYGEGAYRTWALLGSSYGYDPRISQQARRNVVTMADMDGTYRFGGDTATYNHAGGQNVLYADGHVQWVEDNFASENPNDNIFAQDPWDADTDTYLVRGDLNNLTVSFDGYDHLK